MRIFLTLILFILAAPGASAQDELWKAFYETAEFIL